MKRQEENKIIENSFNNTSTDEAFKLQLRLLQEIRDLLKNKK